MRTIFLFYFLISVLSVQAQIERKELLTNRVTEAPVIDGKLDEKEWEHAEIAKDFVMFEPGDGDKEPEDQKTEVKIIYDNSAIYVGAYLYDSHPDKILRQLSERDNFGTADFFAIGISPNNDGQNMYAFFVTSGATQLDAQFSPANGEDSAPRSSEGVALSGSTKPGLRYRSNARSPEGLGTPNLPSSSRALRCDPVGGAATLRAARRPVHPRQHQPRPTIRHLG